MTSTLHGIYPQGWFAVAFSKDIKPGQAKARTFNGQETVLWRSAKGEVHLQPAYCPHLGAHLGHCGKVEGEKIRCPFHGLSFDGDGNCSMKLNRPEHLAHEPPLKPFPVREQNGIIFSAINSQAPFDEWTIPTIDLSDYLEPQTAKFVLNSSPLEITENTVDVLHFSALHHYRKPRIEMEQDGRYMQVRAFMSRPGSLFHKKEPLQIETTTHHYGVGYAAVHIVIPNLKMTYVGFVLPTCRDDKTIDLRFMLYMKKMSIRKKRHVLNRLPIALMNRLVFRRAFKGFVANVDEDLPIWNHKVHLDKPALTPLDGPIVEYRQWANQFYPSMTSSTSGNFSLNIGKMPLKSVI